MSDQDIFDENKVETPTDDDSTKAASGNEGDPSTDLLKTIVNENGEQKYSSVEEALKAAAHAQDHIKNLESELATERNKGNASDKLDELVDIMKSKGSGQGEEDNTSTMKPEDVLRIVQEHLKDEKAAASRDNNIKTVTNVFKDRYGKDASDKLYGKADDLGFSREEINRMIANNPTAALKVLGEDKAAERHKDPLATSGVGAEAFGGKAPEKPETIMAPTSTEKLTDAWKASKRRTLERLGYNPDEVTYK